VATPSKNIDKKEGRTTSKGQSKGVSLIMHFVADMYCTRCHFDIYTLTWYIDEQTLRILSLMVWNHGLKDLKYIFSLKFNYLMYFLLNRVVEIKLVRVDLSPSRYPS
jgi:hypothetical protein